MKNSLCGKEIHVPSYDAEQLGNIIEQRRENAFVDDVVAAVYSRCVLYSRDRNPVMASKH